MAKLSSRTGGADLPGRLWLGVPILFLLAQHVFVAVNSSLYVRVMEGERGAVDLATPLVCLIAIAFGIAVIKNRAALPAGWLTAWIALVCLASLYFAGEELSWGQQVFQWQTPETWKEINDQQETNLHNISSWLDQKPRLLLQVGILFGGVLYPLLIGLQRTPNTRDWGYWFFPTFVVVPTAMIATALHLLDHFGMLQAFP